MTGKDDCRTKFGEARNVLYIYDGAEKKVNTNNEITFGIHNLRNGNKPDSRLQQERLWKPNEIRYKKENDKGCRIVV